MKIPKYVQNLDFQKIRGTCSDQATRMELACGKIILLRVNCP
jgi:hypothetical protein